MALSLAACTIPPPPRPGTFENVLVFERDQRTPPVLAKIEEVSGSSCHRADGGEAGETMARDRMRATAARLGADAVVDVSYTVLQYPPKSPCWKRTVARGTAVMLRSGL